LPYRVGDASPRRGGASRVQPARSTQASTFAGRLILSPTPPPIWNTVDDAVVARL
jgi:hypothetical protein